MFLALTEHYSPFSDLHRVRIIIEMPVMTSELPKTSSSRWPQRLLASGLLALVAVTWQLWTPQEVFPQVPLIRAACHWPGWLDWVSLFALVVSSLVIVITCRDQRRRCGCLGLVISLAILFLLDQHRLQPWAWQFFLLATVLFLADDDVARRGWRWLVIGIYFWSAVSKLDYTFCHEQGPALLNGLKQAMGLRGMPTRLTQVIDVWSSCGIALGELGIALLLAWPRARWVGLWMGTIMHVTLLAALGPLGLNHSRGVLLWNVFFIVQNWLLFRESSAETRNWWKAIFESPSSWRNRLALGVILTASVWPALEPFGFCDHWLAWSVYSARKESATIGYLRTVDSESVLSAVLLRQVVPSRFGGEEVDVNAWSLEQLGVPAYPQTRFYAGVALAVIDRFDSDSVSLLPWPLRDRFTGVASRGRWFEQREQIEQLADSFFWNARPRMATFRVGRAIQKPQSE